MTSASSGTEFRRWPSLLSIACLATLATFNALPNGFTYDDRFVIVANPAVRHIAGLKQFFLLPYWPLHQGGDGYRPLTTLLFATEWFLSPKPWIFHLMSIALYVTCALLVWRVVSRFTDAFVAWWTAALFAVHPVHAEVMGGAVGQSELFAGIALLSGMGLYVQGRVRGPLGMRRQIAIAGAYLAGCLSKENALVFPGVLLAAELTILTPTRPWREALREVRFLALALIAIAGGVILLRSAVIPIGVVGFAPFTAFSTLDADIWTRTVTMLGIVPHWARLLLWPNRLSTEYGPPAYPISDQFRPITWAGLALVVMAITVALRERRRRPVLGFALVWTVTLLLPVSNVLVPSGVLLAERTLFAPSVGACLLLASLIAMASERLARVRPGLVRVAGLVAAGGVLLLGVVRSITRLSDWRDNQALFEAAVRAEPDVYRGHYMLGAWYLETGRWPPAKAEMTRALELFDRDPAIPYNLGLGYFAAGEFAMATKMFQMVERIMPGALDAPTRLALSYAAEGRYDEAQRAAAEALSSHTRDPGAMRAVLQAAALARKSRHPR